MLPIFHASHNQSKVANYLRSNEGCITALGTTDQWPQTLQTTFGLVLTASSPRFIAWGEDLITFYNDSCATIFGSNDLTTLGKPLNHFWNGAWNELKPAFEQVLKGKVIESLDLPLQLHNEHSTDLHFSRVALSPIYESNQIAGIYGEFFEVIPKKSVVQHNPPDITQLMQLFEHSPGMVLFLQGPDFLFAGANQAFQKNIELPCVEQFAKDVKGHSWNPEFKHLLENVFTTGETYSGKNLALAFCHESEPRVVNLVIQPLNNSNGSCWGLMVEAFDITEQQKTIIKLHESERRIWELADTIPQLAWMADETGAVHWYNKRWHEYTGTTPEQLEGWGWQAVHHPDEVHKVLEAWKFSVASGTPFEMTFPMRGSDGNFRPFFCLAVPLKNSAGKIVQWFGTNTDVSTLYRTQDALRKTERLLEEGLITGRMVVWEWDIHNQLAHYSENAREIIGYNSSDPAVAWSTVHPDDVNGLRASVDIAIKQRSPLHQLTRRIRPDTGALLWVETRGHVVLDEHNEPKFMRGMMMDVTDRINAENELKNANRRKDEFLAMLAHELRNPLAPISTSAQILKIPNLDQENIKFASDTIARQVKHMSGLIDDLMDVSRVTRGLVKLQSDIVDLKVVVASALEQAQPLIDARYHTLVSAITDTPTFVRGDATRLIQVITNLLNNAAKYTPEAGNISLNLSINKTEALVTITDNGIGILPSLLPHIFDLFTQAERSPDRSQGGLGLGLTLVKSIVELHGGHVHAQSNGHGTGSTFSIAIPLLLELKTENTFEDLTTPLAASEPLVLMIVDDNLDAAESLSALMKAKGHTVITRHNAYSALEFPDKKSIQIFILDIGLPDIDGYDLARRLKANPHTADALFIALTGYGQPQDRAFSAAAGFDHHLLKPVNINAILNLLAAYKAPQKIAKN